MSKIKIPNLVNPKAVDELVDVLAAGTNYHFVKLWIGSTMRRWLQASHTVVLIPATFAPYLKSLPATGNAYGIVERERINEMPDWAQRALMHGELHEWRWPDEVMMNTYRHWIDYADTLPIRPLRQTVDDLIKQVADWDRKLEKQVLIENLNKGTEVVWEHEDFKIVRLLSREAHDAEGAYMKHCVGTSNYVDRENSEQYSLRGPENLPLATIQLVDVKIVPRPPAHLSKEERHTLLYKWRTDVGMTENAKVMMQVQGRGPEKTVTLEHQTVVNMWFDTMHGPHGFRPYNAFDERRSIDYRVISGGSPLLRMRGQLRRAAFDGRNNPYVGITLREMDPGEVARVRLLPDDDVEARFLDLP